MSAAKKKRLALDSSTSDKGSKHHHDLDSDCAAYTPGVTSSETEKRIRREIANSNERRRMQSINTGFNSLRTMLPKHDGEKLSKAAILQHTAEYIDSLEQEKTRLLADKCKLKRIIQTLYTGQAAELDHADHQLVKRIKSEHIESSNSDSSDEGIQCHPSPAALQGIESDASVDELRNELVEVRKTVDRERKLRMQLEEQVKMLESQLYPERVKEIAQQVQIKFSEGVSSIVDSSEEAAAVASLVDDEVIAETIEIETHSCPDSPSGMPTIVIPASQLSLTNGESQHTTIVEVSSANSLISSRAGRIPRTSKGQQQPAAIALPLDVPFIGGAGASAGAGGTVTVEIISSGINEQSINASNTSRHNLETIVEAIRHLEGDHLFKDEENAAAAAAGGTVAVVKADNVEGEEIVTSGIEEVEVPTTTETATTTNGGVTKTVKLSPDKLTGALRQQVIQCLPVTSSQSRPGVIVAKNQ